MWNSQARLGKRQSWPRRLPRQFIAKSPKNIEVPSGLKKAIERAISARKRCSAWFRTAKVVNEYSNGAHDHFIQVLEKALVLLEPRISEATTKKNGATQSKQDDEAIFGMKNRFDGIEIEDFKGSGGLEQVIVSIEQAKPTPGQAVIDVFELEEESSDLRVSMMIFCFFEDMHVIQEFLYGVRRSYKNDETGLIVASLTTNAAF